MTTREEALKIVENLIEPALEDDTPVWIKPEELVLIRTALSPPPDDVVEAMRSLIKTIDINDGDTLSALKHDKTAIFTASGSWSGFHTLTLGDLRRLADYLRNHIQGRGEDDHRT